MSANDPKRTSNCCKRGSVGLLAQKELREGGIGGRLYAESLGAAPALGWESRCDSFGPMQRRLFASIALGDKSQRRPVEITTARGKECKKAVGDEAR
jgi:hypothetical protein